MTRFALVMAVLAVRIAAGQTLAFDAASVKPNKSGDWRKQLGPAPGGRFTSINTPLRDLIAFAYGVSQDSSSFRIAGPKWIDDDRFDVVANVSGAWTPEQMRDMVRTLLVDRTNLSGLYDFELKWTPDVLPQLPPDAPPLNIDPNGPTIFTALQEQLGLRLESTRSPVDVIVIDRVEHPTED